MALHLDSDWQPTWILVACRTRGYRWLSLGVLLSHYLYSISGATRLDPTEIVSSSVDLFRRRWQKNLAVCFKQCRSNRRAGIGGVQRHHRICSVLGVYSYGQRRDAKCEVTNFEDTTTFPSLPHLARRRPQRHTLSMLSRRIILIARGRALAAGRGDSVVMSKGWYVHSSMVLNDLCSSCLVWCTGRLPARTPSEQSFTRATSCRVCPPCSILSRVPQ